MIELRGVEKRFGDVVALDGLDLRVPPGRVVGLLGPNGSGKTTAMRILMGVIDADDGEILYGGRPIDAPARRRIGYMPEERGLYQGMRARDQLVYLARITGVGRDVARRRAGELIERLGLRDRADEPVERLSLGNQQRVQLAAALVHEPESLVLDEPFSGLDPVAVEELGGILTGAAEEGRTVVVSSHQLDLVEDMCESVAVVDGGSLVLSGDVRELRERTGRRELRIETDGADRGWVRGLAGVRVVEDGPDGLRLALDPSVEPLDVLDAARAAGPVRDFAVRRPRLSELFLEAVGREPR